VTSVSVREENKLFSISYPDSDIFEIVEDTFVIKIVFTVIFVLRS